MNIIKLFETQKGLDAKIVYQKVLEGRDLLPEKILALQVELGELANEWRGFKFWSENQKPRTKQYCLTCGGRGDYQGYIEAPMIEVAMVECTDCEGTGIEKNPLLEEYVDCLYFILSVGIEIRMTDVRVVNFKYEDVTAQFNELFADISETYLLSVNLGAVERTQENYTNVLGIFIGLGQMLGFTWDQIEQAYYDKNKINHDRQENGY